MSKQYEPAEELMMSQFIAQELSNFKTHVHLRLGQPKGFSRSVPAPEETRQLHLSTLPEADLVVRTEKTAAIYEFAVWKPATKLGQLLFYQSLLPSTPGFTDIPQDKIDLYLVTGEMDPQLASTADVYKVRVVKFTTPELEATLRDRHGVGRPPGAQG
jgi:hypothetical protein